MYGIILNYLFVMAFLYNHESFQEKNILPMKIVDKI